MKNAIKAKKHPGKQPTSPRPAPVRAGWWPPPRWAVLGLCLLVAGFGSWMIAEFVIGNSLPANLVGRWEVVDGPPDYQEAVFDFYRSGIMEARVNHEGNLAIIKARVKVEGDKLYSTMKHPQTGEVRRDIHAIRSLTATELVFEDQRGVQMRMKALPRDWWSWFSALFS